VIHLEQTEKMLKLTIKSESGEHEINIHAKTMNELIDDNLPKWLPDWEETKEFLQKVGNTDEEIEQKYREDEFWYYKKARQNE